MEILLIVIGGALGYLWKRQEIAYMSLNENKILESKKFLSCYAASVRYRTRLSEFLIVNNPEKLHSLYRESENSIIELQTQALIIKLFFSARDRQLIDEIADLTKKALDEYSRFVLLILEGGTPEANLYTSSSQIFESVLPEKIKQFTGLLSKTFSMPRFSGK